MTTWHKRYFCWACSTTFVIWSSWETLAVTELLNRDPLTPPQQITALRSKLAVSTHQEMISYVVCGAGGTLLLRSHDVD